MLFRSVISILFWLSCVKNGEVSVKVEYKAMAYTASGKLWVKSPFENKIFQ